MSNPYANELLEGGILTGFGHTEFGFWYTFNATAIANLTVVCGDFCPGMMLRKLIVEVSLMPLYI